MNTLEICNIIAEREGIDVQDARRYIHTFFDVVKEGLIRDENVSFENTIKFRMNVSEVSDIYDISRGRRSGKRFNTSIRFRDEYKNDLKQKYFSENEMD